jgi:hypothetical protein
MSSGGGGNPLKKFAKNVEYGFRDVGSSTADLVAGRGDVGDNLWQLSRGYTSATSGGAADQVIGPGTNETQDKKNDAGAQDTKDQIQMATDQEMARRDAIRKRLDASVAARMQAPGKAQTLLTANGANNPDALAKLPTLLTPNQR